MSNPNLPIWGQLLLNIDQTINKYNDYMMTVNKQNSDDCCVSAVASSRSKYGFVLDERHILSVRGLVSSVVC